MPILLLLWHHAEQNHTLPLFKKTVPFLASHLLDVLGIVSYGLISSFSLAIQDKCAALEPTPELILK